jgi:hypothetical protein
MISSALTALGAPSEAVRVRPADHRVPPSVWQFAPAERGVAKGKRHADRARDHPARIVAIDRDQHEIEIAVERGVGVIEPGRWIVQHKLRSFS